MNIAIPRLAESSPVEWWRLARLEREVGFPAADETTIHVTNPWIALAH